MSRYDVYKAAAGRGFLLDIQSDLLEALNTRVVVPMMPLRIAPKPADRLNPVFLINQKDHVMVTQFLSAVPIAMLGPPIVNIAQFQGQITSAIDMLTQGF